MFERARALAFAVRPIDLALSVRICDAIGASDVVLADVLGDKALDTLTERRDAERRRVAERAARETVRRVALADERRLEVARDEQTAHRAAEALATAVMLKSRQRYRIEVTRG